MEKLDEWRSFGGAVQRYKHTSAALGGLEAKFTVFVPEGATKEAPLPQVWWLSGLTCTDENFTQKAGPAAFMAAARDKVVLVIPDTSPRGAGAPGEDDAYDFGTGAGFYVNATTEAFAKHYRMYEYITKELPELVNANLPVVAGKCSIMGHSMGGHGALTIALKNPGKYASCSAFAPICHPADGSTPWGEKALKGYLGEDRETWKAYDACELVAKYSGPELHILVDQGDKDKFLGEQLKPEELQKACGAKGVALTLRMQPGYDHSYFFISTFIAEHVAHHAKRLSS